MCVAYAFFVAAPDPAKVTCSRPSSQWQTVGIDSHLRLLPSSYSGAAKVTSYNIHILPSSMDTCYFRCHLTSTKYADKPLSIPAMLQDAFNSSSSRTCRASLLTSNLAMSTCNAYGCGPISNCLDVSWCLRYEEPMGKIARTMLLRFHDRSASYSLSDRRN